METARLFGTLVSTNQSARRLNPREHYQNRHRREKLKTDICKLCPPETIVRNVIMLREVKRRKRIEKTIPKKKYVKMVYCSF
jgi:hypothetical protein